MALILDIPASAARISWLGIVATRPVLWLACQTRAPSARSNRSQSSLRRSRGAANQ